MPERWGIIDTAPVSSIFHAVFSDEIEWAGINKKQHLLDVRNGEMDTVGNAFECKGELGGKMVLLFANVF